MPIEYNHDHEKEITLFGEVNFRNTGRRFGIRTDDRRRHMYIIGKTGMGKSTLMENMILADIYAGHGCCYVDPHGDTAEMLIDFIPPERINDVVYFNPADTAYPFGFNILETPSEDRKHLVRDGLMGVFKKIWPDVWSARMEYILQNCVSALLDYPGATLMGINRLLVDKDYREKVVEKIRDPIVKTFWVAEFTQWSEKYATEAIAPVQNKVGQFLSSSLIRNIVAQTRTTMDIRRIMDEGKILIVNLSKGRVGEDGMRLLGGMMVTKIQLSAQERQNMPAAERRDFYLYVDEFQNFANESFATILSEARKYRLNLTVAHQYMAQLEEPVQEAILGNVGTIIAMRIGPQDAAIFETEFAPTFMPEDLVSLAKFQMYLRLMVDGVATQPFSANSLPPIAKRMHSQEKVIQVSRERYGEARHVIEQKVLKWTGMEFTHMAEGEAPEGESEQRVAGEAQEGMPSIASNIPTPTIRIPGVQGDATPGISGTVIPSNIQYPKVMTEDEQDAHDALAAGGSGVSMPKLVLKPERMDEIERARKAAKEADKMKKRPSFPHTCQRCGKNFELAVQLDPTKPIYCQECRALLLKEREERAARPRSSSGGGDRPPRSGGSPSGAGQDRPPRSTGERPPRRGEDRPRSEDRPRGEGRPPRNDRPRDDRPPSGFSITPRTESSATEASSRAPLNMDLPRSSEEGGETHKEPSKTDAPRPLRDTPPSIPSQHRHVETEATEAPRPVEAERFAAVPLPGHEPRPTSFEEKSQEWPDMHVPAPIAPATMKLATPEPFREAAIARAHIPHESIPTPHAPRPSVPDSRPEVVPTASTRRSDDNALLNLFDGDGPSSGNSVAPGQTVRF